MWGDLIAAAMSLGILAGGAEFLVRGSSSLARRLGLTPLVIGLTVVAYGTSTPELVVSLEAAWTGHGDIAVGNVVGSNILNVGAILGLTALICPVRVSLPVIRFDAPIMIVVSVACVGLVALEGVSRASGLALVALLAAYTAFNVCQSRRSQSGTPAAEEEVPSVSRSQVLDLAFIAGGLVLLVIGSRLLVTSAIAISRALNVSEAVIGLTVVAAGTSMPELATSVVAALRRHPDIAIGNVVGSNIFNVLGILGISSLVHPLSAPGVGMRDGWVMLAFAAAILPMLWTSRRLIRIEGVLLLAGYCAYLWVLWPAA